MMNKNAVVLNDVELENVAGGTVAETKEFIDAILENQLRYKKIGQAEYNRIKSESLSGQAAECHLLFVRNFGGQCQLECDERGGKNIYLMGGVPTSHGGLMRFFKL